MITAEQFKAATGSEPDQDDLERCNCHRAGNFGHHNCGWCHVTNLPVFMCVDHARDGHIRTPHRATVG